MSEPVVLHDGDLVDVPRGSPSEKRLRARAEMCALYRSPDHPKPNSRRADWEGWFVGERGQIENWFDLMAEARGLIRENEP